MLPISALQLPVGQGGTRRGLRYGAIPLCCIVLCCIVLLHAVTCCVVPCRRALLSEPRRFVVVSIETKLLVLLPTTSNGMVAICARRVAQSEDLTADVVKTIMAVGGPAEPQPPCRYMGSKDPTL